MPQDTTISTKNQPVKLLRLREVMGITGLGRTSIYRKMKEGTFPSSVTLGAKAVAWRSDDLNAWVEAL